MTMRAKDVILNQSYRHKDHPNYGWAKVIKILQPKEAENPHNRIILKCEWTVLKDDYVGMVKYFRPSNFIKG